MKVLARRGHEFEAEFFGHQLYRKTSGVPEYLDYDTSVWECLLRQPKHWDPFKPTTTLARTLRYWVLKHFGPGGEAIGLYCAIGQSLDFWHHVDGFFFLGQKTPPFSKHSLLTFDLSLGDKIDRKVKSSLLLTADNFRSRKHDLKEIGIVIARYLKTGKRFHRKEFNWGPLRSVTETQRPICYG